MKRRRNNPMSGLYDRLKMAREELREWAKDNPDDDEPDERIHEIADSSVPVYNSDILQCAMDDFDLALTVPEIGPAFGGESTAVNIIAANIYERIEGDLREEWKRIEEAREEAEEE